MEKFTAKDDKLAKDLKNYDFLKSDLSNRITTLLKEKKDFETERLMFTETVKVESGDLGNLQKKLGQEKADLEYDRQNLDYREETLASNEQKLTAAKADMSERIKKFNFDIKIIKTDQAAHEKSKLQLLEKEKSLEDQKCNTLMVKERSLRELVRRSERTIDTGALDRLKLEIDQAQLDLGQAQSDLDSKEKIIQSEREDLKMREIDLRDRVTANDTVGKLVDSDLKKYEKLKSELEVTLKSFVGEKTAFDQEKTNFYGNREDLDKQISAHKESLRLLEVERQGLEEERL
jgi:uncharacterized protein (DUF3084 family)